MKTKLISLITFLSLILLPAKAFCALAAEPFTDADLAKYGASEAFAATVQIENNCSANRIVTSDDVPYDFYITAAHCLEGGACMERSEEVLNIILEKVNTLEAIKKLESLALAEEVIELTKAQMEDYFEGEVCENDFNNPEEIAAQLDLLIKDLIAIFENNESITSIKDAEELLSLLPKNKDALNSSDIKYIIHSDEKIDLAVFTLYEPKSNKPKYPLYQGNIHFLQGAEVTSVGYGASAHNPSQLVLNPRQAFNTIIGDSRLNKQTYSIYFQPNLPLIKLTGIVTSGDSGGALLKKNDKNEYHIAGVVAASSAIRSKNFTDYVDLYKRIPSALKTNTFNKDCDQRLAKGETLGDECYGHESSWTKLDHQFIEEAIQTLIKQAP